jgi:hypothetical protein
MRVSVSDQYAYMVWGALCAVVQSDGVSNSTPCPSALEELLTHTWDATRAVAAIRYLTGSTRRFARVHSLLDWISSEAQMRGQSERSA